MVFIILLKQDSREFVGVSAMSLIRRGGQDDNKGKIRESDNQVIAEQFDFLREG